MRAPLRAICGWWVVCIGTWGLWWDKGSRGETVRMRRRDAVRPSRTGVRWGGADFFVAWRRVANWVVGGDTRGVGQV